MNKFNIVFLNGVREFIATLPEEDRAKIRGSIRGMELDNFDSLYIKTLKTPIRELIIKNYRFIFFIDKNEIWFIKAFIKKTTKTPTKEIENAKKLYNKIISLK